MLHNAELAVEVHGAIENVHDLDDVPNVPAHVIEDSGWYTGNVPPGFFPAVDPLHERIMSSRVQRLSLPVHDVHYGTALQSGSVRLLGTRYTPARASDWTPWRIVQVLSFLGGFLVFLFAMWMHSNYVDQHAWFGQLGASGKIVLLSFVAWIAGAAAFYAMLCGRRTWSPLTAWIPAGTTLLCFAGITALSLTARPSGALAREFLERADIDAAALTAEAALTIHTSDGDAKAVLDELHSRRLLSTGTLAEASAVLLEDWKTDAARTAAIRAFRRRAMNEFDEKLGMAHFSEVESLAKIAQRHAPDMARAALLKSCIQQMEAALRDGGYVKALANLDSAMAAGMPLADSNSVKARLASAIDQDALERFQESKTRREPSDRSDLLRNVGALLALRGSLTDAPSSVSLDALSADQASAELELVAKRARERRAEAVAQRQRAAEERRRAAEEERENWANSPLLCRDGSYSPSCTCGGPRRGCCSWHGGVAGCSAGR